MLHYGQGQRQSAHLEDWLLPFSLVTEAEDEVVPSSTGGAEDDVLGSPAVVEETTVEEELLESEGDVEVLVVPVSVGDSLAASLVDVDVAVPVTEVELALELVSDNATLRVVVRLASSVVVCVRVVADQLVAEAGVVVVVSRGGELSRPVELENVMDDPSSPRAEVIEVARVLDSVEADVAESLSVVVARDVVLDVPVADDIVDVCISELDWVAVPVPLLEEKDVVDVCKLELASDVVTPIEVD